MSEQSDEVESTRSGNKKPEESRIRLLIIVLGSFILYFCSWGLAQSFGVLYIELRDKFGGTKAEAAWVQSLFGGILLASGPVTGILLNRFGCRIVGIAGSLILFAGLLSSAFSPSLHILYVTYGLVGGIGGSLLFTTAGVVVLEHFDKRASLAVGIAGSGASAGTIVIPLLSHACLDALELKWTFVILSGLSLPCLISSLTFTPPVFTIKADQHSIEDDTSEAGNTKTALAATDSKDTSDSNNTESGNNTGRSIRSIRSLFSFINAGYVAFAISWAVMMLPFLVPFLYLPDVALDRGVTKQEAAFIASSMGIGSMAGRAGFGFLGDIKWIETTLMHIVPITLFGTLSLVFSFVHGFTNFLILAILIGLLSAICDGIHPVITYQLVGAKNIGVGLGLLYSLMSVTTILGTPIAGWISESAGRYDEALYYCAGLSFLAAAVAIYIPYWKRKHTRSEKK